LTDDHASRGAAIYSRRFAHPLRAIGAEEQRRLIAVVALAAQAQVLDRRGAARRVGLEVVELEKPAFAASSVRAHERALALIACPRLRREADSGKYRSDA
jgi:hypothetical protein